MDQDDRANPVEHAAEREHQKTDAISSSVVPAVKFEDNKKQAAPTVATTSQPNQHGINEALIARWTKRLGIYTGILAIATVLLVVATGISAFFLWETDVAIEGQLREMHAQNITTRAQVRANIIPQLWVIQHFVGNDGKPTAWEVTPRWKNNGATDALEVRSWWRYWIIDQHWNDLKELRCPDSFPPAETTPKVIQAGGEFMQQAFVFPAEQITKALTHDAAILIGVHIDYRDIFFPDDPERLIDSCDNLVPNDPINDKFSFLSLSRTGERECQATGKTTMSKRRKKPGMRGRFYKRMTPEEEAVQREAAFAAIRLLYGEALPLWRFCRKGYCRRHKRCCGEIRPCLKRAWPLLPPETQNEAYAQVAVGGPRRLPPSTHSEWVLRRYAPSNFVH